MSKQNNLKLAAKEINDVREIASVSLATTQVMAQHAPKCIYLFIY